MSVPLLRGSAPHSESTPLHAEFGDVKMYNSCYTGVSKTELPFEDVDYAHERDRSINHKVDDGVKPMTQEEQDFERAASWKLVKKFTMNILKMDFTKFSFPVAYSEPRSFLERTADLFSFLATKYIDKAIDTGMPDRRIAILAAGVIASFYIQMQSKKPWNPVLGETYVGRWENGATIYGEQTSHHPPISDFQIYGPDNKWYCYAHCKFTINSGMTKVDVLQTGVFHLELDNTVYEFEFPSINVLGILRGDRVVRVKSPFIIRDLTNDITLKLELHPKKDSKIGITRSTATTLYGGIINGEGAYVGSIIHGDYTENVTVDGEEIWNINNDFSHKATAQVHEDELLFSDVRYRLDRAFLIQNKPEEADLAKLAIEELQRRDSKLRASDQ